MVDLVHVVPFSTALLLTPTCTAVLASTATNTTVATAIVVVAAVGCCCCAGSGGPLTVMLAKVHMQPMRGPGGGECVAGMWHAVQAHMALVSVLHVPPRTRR